MKTPISRLVELSAKCHEFAGIPLTAQEAARKKGQTPEGNFVRAVGINATVGSPYALPVSIHNAHEAAEADQVYRKRDAFTDSVRQTAPVTGGIVAGAALGAGGSRLAHTAEESLAKKAGREFLVSPAIKSSRALKLGGVGALAGLGLGAVGGYKLARNANKRRIAANQELSAMDRLTELSRKIELGIFTSNRPKYSQDGQFEGMDRKLNPVGYAAAGLGAAGAAYGGISAHGAVMNNYGKDAGSIGSAYSNLGKDVAGGFKTGNTFGPLPAAQGEKFGATAGKFAGRKAGWVSSLIKAGRKI